MYLVHDVSDGEVLYEGGPDAGSLQQPLRTLAALREVHVEFLLAGSGGPGQS